jgi:xanthine dehydrogenase YagS FAD-binding subunit
MNPFHYVRAGDTTSAVSSFAGEAAPAHFLAGGTNLIDLMREGIERPRAIVDITRLPLTGIDVLPDGGVRIGAMVRNSHLAADPAIRDRFPLLSQAILNGASAQLRNMATTGGNLMQRTRCYYFYDSTTRCNKREPGRGCDALDGFNRIHAILGGSPHCIATHPSDMCVALAALDAVVNVVGPSGERTLAFSDFHRLPGETPNIDTNLRAGELITSVDLPGSSAQLPSTYRKVRDRASYAFALVSVAAALRLEDGRVRDVRIALGGVAHKPWRASAAERLLAGSEVTIEAFARAADAELAPAVPQAHNRFKIALAKRVIVSALSELAGAAGSLR